MRDMKVKTVKQDTCRVFAVPAETSLQDFTAMCNRYFPEMNQFSIERLYNGKTVIRDYAEEFVTCVTETVTCFSA